MRNFIWEVCSPILFRVMLWAGDSESVGPLSVVRFGKERSCDAEIEKLRATVTLLMATSTDMAQRLFASLHVIVLTEQASAMSFPRQSAITLTREFVRKTDPKRLAGTLIFRGSLLRLQAKSDGREERELICDSLRDERAFVRLLDNPEESLTGEVKQRMDSFGCPE